MTEAELIAVYKATPRSTLDARRGWWLITAAVRPGQAAPTPEAGYRLLRSLARPVALGYLPFRDALVAVAPHVVNQLPPVPDVRATIRVMAWALREDISRFRERRGVAEHRAERAAWPLCEQRRPGLEIIAAAQRAAGPTLRRDEVVELCRDVAGRSIRKARHGRR